MKSIIAFGVCLAAISATAFPPAPHHTLFGLVRNQWGDPIDVTGALVFLQTSNSVGVKASITASAEPGVNYRLNVPMDSGLTPDPYQATALFRGQSFLLKVQIGSVVYLPLEMALNSIPLGQSGEETRLDLTLGEDSDGDGLPDAWEEAIIALLGGTLADITPDGDSDGDGMSNHDEYVAGTFAFDPNDGFALTIQEATGVHTHLEFMALRGRTYSIFESANLENWAPASFRVIRNGSTGPLQTEYRSTDVRILQVEVPVVTIGGPTKRYYKAIVQ